MTPKVVVVTPSTHDLPTGWSAEQFTEVVQRAADKWSFPNVPCGVKVTVAKASAAWRAAEDGTNLIAFRGRTWCHNERCGAQSTFPLRATGMTTTHPAGTTGRAVVEADVEINGTAFKFSGNGAAVTEAAGGKWTASLEAVLVHEIGHVLGLPDACGTERRPSGRPIMSDCGPDDRLRVMFPSGLRDRLSSSDVSALCQLYPGAGNAAVEVAALPARHGCACNWGSPGGPISTWLPIVIAIGAVFLSLRARASGSVSRRSQAPRITRTASTRASRVPSPKRASPE